MKQHKRYKRVIVTSAAVVTIGAGLVGVPLTAHAADARPVHQHSSVQRKAPAWRVGLRAAEAKVLGMTVDEYKEARRTKKLNQLVKDAGLTPAQFADKVKTELTAEWKAAGVSDKEIAARLAKLAKHHNNREHRWERAKK